MTTLQKGDGPTVHVLPDAISESRFVYHEVFADQVYLRHGVTIRDNDCIIDIGANVGMFSMFAMQSAKSLNIFAFEPVPPIRDLLTKNTSPLTESGSHNLKVLPYGLSGEQKTLEIAFFPRSPANSTCYLDEKNAEADVVGENLSISDVWKYDKLSAIGLALCVPWLRKRLISRQMKKTFSEYKMYDAEFLRLDDVIAEHGIEQIDLLKIDVEGSEFDVLSGMSEETWSRVQQVVMEISPAHFEQIEPLRAKMLERGFDRVELETMGHGEFVADSGSTSSLYAIRQPR